MDGFLGWILMHEICNNMNINIYRGFIQFNANIRPSCKKLPAPTTIFEHPYKHSQRWSKLLQEFVASPYEMVIFYAYVITLLGISREPLEILRCHIASKCWLRPVVWIWKVSDHSATRALVSMKVNLELNREKR